VIVCVPYTVRFLHRNTLPAIAQIGFPMLVCPITPSHSYLAWFDYWWHSYKTGFMIVEHDVEIILGGRTVLEEFNDCAEPWCVSPYNDNQLLGCSKFVPKSLAINWSVVKDRTQEGWKGLDMGVSKALRGYGYRPHVHPRGTIHHRTRHEQ